MYATCRIEGDINSAVSVNLSFAGEVWPIELERPEYPSCNVSPMWERELVVAPTPRNNLIRNSESVVVRLSFCLKGGGGWDQPKYVGTLDFGIAVGPSGPPGPVGQTLEAFLRSQTHGRRRGATPKYGLQSCHLLNLVTPGLRMLYGYIPVS